MSNKKRLQYLETKWEFYPAIEVKTLTVHEMKMEFSKITAGGASKSDSFYLGGRITRLVKSALSEEIEQFCITCGGEELFLKSDILLPQDRELLNEVLAPGDQVLIRVAWTHVFTSGLFPKIENMSPMELKLLAPSKMEPLVSAMSVKQSKQWNFFLELIHQCFKILDFNEVRTPTLVTSPGLEPFLDPFTCEFSFGKSKRTLYLPTSPEFSLKKVLSLGHERIYEMKPSFRNEELSPHHQPEFLMLEWYRAYSNLDTIAKDVKGLLNYLKLHWPESIKGWGPVREVTVAELFKQDCDFELTPQTTRVELASLALEMGVSVSDSDDWDDVFYKIFLEKIEPHLGVNGPIIVRKYPASQAAWSRITSDGWADRFEVYWRGVELANAFHELNDPVEQRKRFNLANEKRKALGKPEMPIDEDLMRALESGFPPSGGIALGLDRLFMLLINATDIANTRHFGI